MQGAPRLTSGEIAQWADLLARALWQRGVRPGDRVFSLMANSLEWVIAAFATWKVGAVFVAEHKFLRPDPLRQMLQELRPRALFLDQEGSESVLDVLRLERELFQVVFVNGDPAALPASLGAESLAEVLFPRGADAPPPPPSEPLPVPPLSPDEVATISYTSGSTGRPKGVMHTHESWLAGAAFTKEYHALSATDSVIVSFPLQHGLAFRQLLAYLWASATVILADDLLAALEQLAQVRSAALLLVPAACNLLLDHFATTLQQASRQLTYLEIGAGALSPQRYEQLKRLLPETPIHLPYGLTEARVAYLQPGSQGLLNALAALSPGLEVEVIDPDGRPVARGQTGEIRLRGKGLMRGYWGSSAEQQQALRREGFRTGDRALLTQQGEVELLGRVDQMLKVGGRKVHPEEVERVLGAHPGVAESAVVGVPDPPGLLENILHAFVVLKLGGHAPSEADLLEHCRRHLEPYKVPSRIHFRSALPRSPVGKVLNNALIGEVAD